MTESSSALMLIVSVLTALVLTEKSKCFLVSIIQQVLSGLDVNRVCENL